MSTKKIQIVGSTVLVSYNPQELNDDQREQARENIGIYIAADEDIKEGKIAATGNGIVTGTHVCE